MSKLISGSLMLGVLVLAGCSTGSSEASKANAIKVCAAITGAAVSDSVDQTCVGCAVADGALAVDGKQDTFAFVDLPAAFEAGVALRAQAPAGTIYEAGSRPTVLLQVLKIASVENTLSIGIRTYHNGELRQEETDNGSAVQINGMGSTGLIAVTLTATEPFDSVELNLTGTFEGLSAEVYEFCSDAE